MISPYTSYHRLNRYECMYQGTGLPGPTLGIEKKSGDFLTTLRTEFYVRRESWTTLATKCRNFWTAVSTEFCTGSFRNPAKQAQILNGLLLWLFNRFNRDFLNIFYQRWSDNTVMYPDAGICWITWRLNAWFRNDGVLHSCAATSRWFDRRTRNYGVFHNISLPQIGEALGGRDHTTVMHACDKVADLIERDDFLRRQIIKIREQLYGRSPLANG